MEHVVIGLGEIHRPHNWEWADATARANEVVTDTTLINCFGLQLSDNSLWRLSAAAPAVWTSVAVSSVASADGTVTVTNTNGAIDLSVPITGSTSNVVAQVRNTTGATLSKGTVVYISGATGQIPTVSKALATSDATSAQTLGMVSENLANNTNGYVTIIGLLTGMNTSAFTDGAQLYLSGTTAGTYTSTKTLAPTHLVYVGVVEHAHATQGKIFVKVQNGYEMDELHNVSAASPANGQTLIYNGSNSLWESVPLTYSSLTGTIPTWNQNTTGNAANVTGIVAIANGGTGTTTPGIVAGTNITVSGTWPNQTVNSTASGGGSGTVTSVAQSFTGGIISVAGSPVTTSGTLALTVAGTSGGIPYFSSGTTWASSAAGTAGQVLTSNGAAAPSWTTVGGLGTVTSVDVSGGTTGLTTSGGPIVTTGTITLGGTLAVANGGTGVTTSTGSGSTVLSTSPTLVTPVLGTPTSGNLSNCTADGTNFVGYLNVPQNAQTGAYTLVLADGGKHIYHASGDAAATYTIPAATSVAYPIGTVISFVNLSANNVTIAITTDTMYLVGYGSTGSRTLSQYGVATATKVSGTSSAGIWIISGVGLT
jgi:hypothetical protein